MPTNPFQPQSQAMTTNNYGGQGAPSGDMLYGPGTPNPWIQQWQNMLPQAYQDSVNNNLTRDQFLGNINRNAQSNAASQSLNPQNLTDINAWAANIWDTNPQTMARPTAGSGAGGTGGNLNPGVNQGGPPNVQNLGIDNNLLRSWMNMGLTQRNEQVFPQMMDISNQLRNMPGAGNLMNSPDFTQLRNSFYNNARQDIVSEAERMIGNIPGYSNTPTDRQGQPLITRTGALQEMLSRRGGTRMHPGAYAAGLGEVLSGMEDSLSRAGNNASINAMSSGLQGRSQDIQRLLGSAGVAGEAPTMYQPARDLLGMGFDQWFRPWAAGEGFNIDRERIAAMLQAAGLPWEMFGGMNLFNPFGGPPGPQGGGNTNPPPATPPPSGNPFEPTDGKF